MGGAFTGSELSNTFMFNKKLGWRGVLIEASPSSFAKLKNNRKDEIALVNEAVCSEKGKVHYIDSGPENVRGIFEFMDQRFLNHWHPNVTVDQLPEIECDSVTAILLNSGIKHVDFFSLDVEGGELQVLATVNFAKISFGVLAIEALY